MARLAELAHGYMAGAVRLRMGLGEVRAELESGEDGGRRELEGRAKLRRQMLLARTSGRKQFAPHRASYSPKRVRGPNSE